MTPDITSQGYPLWVVYETAAGAEVALVIAWDLHDVTKPKPITPDGRVAPGTYFTDSASADLQKRLIVNRRQETGDLGFGGNAPAWPPVQN